MGVRPFVDSATSLPENNQNWHAPRKSDGNCLPKSTKADDRKPSSNLWAKIKSRQIPALLHRQQQVVPARRVRPGSIPAQAGEPQPRGTHLGGGGVYPRTGGGTPLTGGGQGGLQGLSPHRRGNPVCRLISGTLSRSIPAQAGEPISEFLLTILSRVYPRTGGGTFADFCHRHSSEGLSPHRRGNLSYSQSPSSFPRSIPAQAGEPDEVAFKLSLHRVYPRTGGGTPARSRLPTLLSGLSPHRRGNPFVVQLA